MVGGGILTHLADTRHTLCSMRRQHLTETWLVLGVSLGASAIWSLLRIVEKVTRPQPLGSQTTAMNSSVTPDRPWLDLAFQLVLAQRARHLDSLAGLRRVCGAYPRSDTQANGPAACPDAHAHWKL